MKLKLDIKGIVLVSLIYTSLDVMWMIYNSYVPIYLQAGNASFAAGIGILGFGFTPAITGFLMTLDNIAALIIGPFVGMFSDSLKSKMGRRKPFIVLSMPFMVASLILIPLIPEWIPANLNGHSAQLTGLLIPFMGVLFLLLISNSVMFGPGRVLLFDITPSEHRTTANGICNVLDGLMMFVVIGGGALLYKLYRPLPMWAAAGFILIAVIVVWVFIKEPKVTDSSANEAKTSPRQIVRTIRTLPTPDSKSLIFYCLTMIFTYLGLSLGQAFVTSYAVSVLHTDTGTASLLMIALAVIAMVMALPAALLANRYGRKKMMLIGDVICLLISISLFFIPNLTFTFIAVSIFALGWIFSNISHVPMMLDHSPSEKLLGTFLSIVFFTSTISLIIGPILGGWLVGLFGNNYSVIWLMIASFFGLAILSLVFVTRGEAKKEITAEVKMEAAGEMV